jgi:probable phosphoglycerate mutase
MTRVILVRHGQTDWNRERRFQGHIDVPLNDVGQAEAGRLALCLGRQSLAAIYSSDLARALQTARPVALAQGLALNTAPDLRERNYGVFEGMTLEEIATQFPQECDRWRSHDPDYRIPNGESQFQFRSRIFLAVDAIAMRHPASTILIVTHGGALDMYYRRAHSLAWDAPRSCPVPNAAINLLDWTPDRVSVLTWASSGHLAEHWSPRSV